MMRRPVSLALALLTMGLTLLACAPAPPGPAAAVSSTPTRAWLPNDAPPRAAILALHGFNDYSNAFADLGEYAAARGFAVHAYDQRGFGANADAGYWPGVPVMVADLRREVDRLKELYPELPVYVLGESMGAAVVIAAAARGESPAVAGSILVAPAVWGGEQLNPLYRATLWLAVQLVPNMRLTGRSLEVLASDNIEMLVALGQDPLVIKGTRVNAIAGLVGLMDLALPGAAAMRGPLLVLGGARDEIVPPRAHAAMLERLTAHPCTEVVYPEGWHMLLRDLQRQVVWDDILAWVAGEPLPSELEGPCGVDLKSVVASLPRS